MSSNGHITSKTGVIVDNGTLVRYDGDEDRFRIPEGIHTVAGGAFEGSSCRTIIVGSGVHTIGVCGLSSQSVSEIIFEDGIRIIGAKAAWNCRRLRKVTLPSTLETIESNAFEIACVRKCAVPIQPVLIKIATRWLTANDTIPIRMAFRLVLRTWDLDGNYHYQRTDDAPYVCIAGYDDKDENISVIRYVGDELLKAKESGRFDYEQWILDGCPQIVKSFDPVYCNLQWDERKFTEVFYW